MPGPLDMQRNQMAQNMAGAPASGGLQPQMGPPVPPPQMGGQQPPGAQSMGGGQSQVKPLLDQALQIIVQGNPADLQALGEFMAQIQSMVERHNAMGQGTAQSAPAPPATPIP